MTKNIRQIPNNIDFFSSQILNVAIHKVQTLPTIDLFAGKIVYHEIEKQYYYYDGIIWVPFKTTLPRWINPVRIAVGSNVNISTLVSGDTLDGILLNLGDRVLLYGQSLGSQNGVYVIGSTNGSTLRSSDFNESYEFFNAITSVLEGLNSSKAFQCITENPIVDTTNIEFIQFGITVEIPDATISVKGIIRIATLQEVIDGIVPDASVTPYTLKERLTPIEELLEKLKPTEPKYLSFVSLILIDQYSAREQGSGTIHECTDLQQPTLRAEEFYDGDAGTLIAYIDSVESGTRVLSPASDVSTEQSLQIYEDKDPYIGQPSAEGFYKVLSARIIPTANLSIAQHTLELSHSLTGSSSKTFYVDDPVNVAISLPIVTDPLHGTPAEISSNYKYISGVPSLKQGISLQAMCNILNAVKTHYATNFIGLITGTGFINKQLIVPITPPITDQTISINDMIVVNDNVFVDKNVQFTFVGYNSKQVAGTPSNVNKKYHIDTVSNELNRITSGSGEFPTVFGGAYNSEESLVLNEELQLINGKYQYPVTDYSDLNALAGPDYSGLTGYRWVTFLHNVSLSNNSGFMLQFLNVEGTWTGTNKITSGMKIYAQVQGSTGWLDCNDPYDGVSTPVNNDDSAMIADNNSTYVQKKVTFGQTTRSGQLYVRVGLPETSDKKFSDISITAY